MLRQVGILSLLLVCGLVTAPAQAGVYSTFDADAEVKQYSRDYRNVFKPLLDAMKTIPYDSTESHSPIRKRYLLLEQLGQAGASKLKSLEDKLNYSAVLIRRGKANEATQYLLPLTREHPENFIVWSQCATAHFLADNSDFRDRSPELMKQAIDLWPKKLDDVKKEMLQFLNAIGLTDIEFEQLRKSEVHFERLIRNRLREERLAKLNKVIESTVDPIFLEANGERKPVRYVNAKGEFEPGRIAELEKKKLPEDAIEIVEQMLYWMPHDKRLLWQLGELLNASAMDAKTAGQKNRLLRDASFLFRELNFAGIGARVGGNEIERRAKKLAEHVSTLPPEHVLHLHLDP